MPFTPFHIAAGASVKAIVPKHFSWSVFTLTNILIDCEPLYYHFTEGMLSHKFFHSIIGASIVTVVCATLGKPLCEYGLKLWNNSLAQEDKRWLGSGIKISHLSAWTGAVIGAYSHLILDSIMHLDIKPLAPFTDENQLLEIMEIFELYILCLLLFGLGVIIYSLKKSFYKT
jgi:hypothetical protein